MRRRGGFTIVEMATTVAVLIIVLGLMISLAHHVRESSADLLTKDILHRLDQAMTAYLQREGTLPEVTAFIADNEKPQESELPSAAERNNESFVHALKSQGLFNGLFNDLSIAYYDEVRIRDAWGSPIVFMAKMHPSIGMASRGWFFFSAGPDRRYLTRDDNINSYDQPVGGYDQGSSSQ